MTAALITARGGSVRLPRKNTRPFCGVPLFLWTVLQAQCSHLIDKVYVSTDDDEIEKLAKEAGAIVIRRPDWPDAAQASAIRPMIHGIREIQRIHGDAFDTLVSILPTGPLNLPGDFDKAIRLFRQIGCDVIGPLIPLREVVLYTKMGSNRARARIISKGYKYLGPGGGWCVTSPCWYLWMASTLESDLDSKLDAGAEAEGDGPSIASYYFAAEPWQYADCDTQAEFELGEIIMEHFILKGRGAAIYAEYAAEKDTVDDLLGKYAGNLAQQ